MVEAFLCFFFFSFLFFAYKIFIERVERMTFQYSWIEQIVQNPDVFSFIDYPCKTVNLSVLKVQPEETSKELLNWLICIMNLVIVLLSNIGTERLTVAFISFFRRSLDLLDILLHLGENRKLTTNVLRLFDKACACVDVVLLGLTQVPVRSSQHLFSFFS